MKTKSLQIKYEIALILLLCYESGVTDIVTSIFLGPAEGEPAVNGDENGNDPEKPKKEDTIIITGKKENAEAARDALQVG